MDNAHSWMAIIYRCAGLKAEARALNQQILLRFPLTRHADYARARMKEPDKVSSGCGAIRQAS